jgi:hypothetical protein
MYAEGGSWAGIAAHRGYWSNQRYRTTTALVTGELLYGVELQVGDADSEVKLQQQLDGVLLEGAMRFGESGWLGLGYTRGVTDVLIRSPEARLPADFAPGARIEISNVLLNAEIDSRDSDLYPSSGHYAQGQIAIAREDLGSDDDYTAAELEWNGYRSIREAHVLAWRLAGKLVDGEAPFFALAWFGAGVDLRGYTPGRSARWGRRRALQARKGAAAQYARRLRVGSRRQYVRALDRRGVLSEHYLSQRRRRTRLGTGTDLFLRCVAAPLRETLTPHCRVGGGLAASFSRLLRMISP